MKKLIEYVAFGLISFLLAAQIMAQAPVEKYICLEQSRDLAVDFAHTVENIFVLGRVNYNSPSEDIMLLINDKFGNVESTVFYGNKELDEYPNSLFSIGDDLLIISNVRYSDGSGRHINLIKINKAGVVLSNVDFGMGAGIDVVKVRKGLNNDVWLLVRTFESGGSEYSYHLLQFNFDGQLQDNISLAEMPLDFDVSNVGEEFYLLFPNGDSTRLAIWDHTGIELTSKSFTYSDGRGVIDQVEYKNPNVILASDDELFKVSVSNFEVLDYVGIPSFGQRLAADEFGIWMSDEDGVYVVEDDFSYRHIIYSVHLSTVNNTRYKIHGISANKFGTVGTIRDFGRDIFYETHLKTGARQEWRTYGKEKFENSSIINALNLKNDGSYDVLYTQSLGYQSSLNNCLVGHMNKEGDLLNSVNLLGNLLEVQSGMGMTQTKDGGTAAMLFDEKNGTYLKIVKLDNNYNVDWIYSEEVRGFWEERGVIKLDNHNNIITLNTVQVDNSGIDYVQVNKINMAGDLVWKLQFTGLDYAFGFDIVHGSNNHYYLTYVADSSVLMELSNEGNILNRTSIGMPNNINYWPTALLKTSSNELVAAGRMFIRSTSTNVLRNDRFVKLNLTGDTIWTYTSNLPGFNRGNFTKIIETQDGNYVAAGWVTPVGLPEVDICRDRQGYLVKVSRDGEMLWECFIDRCQQTLLEGIVELDNGELAVAGYTTENATQCGYFAILNSEGKLVGEQIIENPKEALIISPNPVDDKLTLPYATGVNGGQLTIFNLDGKLILTHQINDELSELEIDVSHMPSGVYILNINSDESVQSGKFIKL